MAGTLTWPCPQSAHARDDQQPRQQPGGALPQGGRKGLAQGDQPRKDACKQEFHILHICSIITPQKQLSHRAGSVSGLYLRSCCLQPSWQGLSCSATSPARTPATKPTELQCVTSLSPPQRGSCFHAEQDTPRQVSQIQRRKWSLLEKLGLATKLAGPLPEQQAWWHPCMQDTLQPAVHREHDGSPMRGDAPEPASHHQRSGQLTSVSA